MYGLQVCFTSCAHVWQANTLCGQKQMYALFGGALVKLGTIVVCICNHILLAIHIGKKMFELAEGIHSSLAK